MTNDQAPGAGLDEQGAAAPDFDGQHQRVTWAELFFDLSWVLAITQVSIVLAHAHSVGEAARVLVLLVPLWWCWVGAAMVDNASGSSLDRLRGRIVLFLMAACGLAMSVAVPEAFGDRGVLFAVAFVAMRAILWVETTRQGRFRGIGLNPFGIALFVGGPLFLVGAFVDGPWRTALWAAGAISILLGPALAGFGGRAARLTFDLEHLPERFGLFIIIALGETVVAMGGQAASIPLGGLELGALAIGFVLIVLLWWTYFHYGASTVRHSLRTNPRRAIIVRDILSYGHLGYVIGIIAIAVGLKVLLAHPLEHPHGIAELLLAPGAAVYFLTFCFARWRMFGAPLWPRLIAALACIAIAVAAPLLPQIGIAALVTAVALALNGFEAWIVETGRPVPVVRLPFVRPDTQG